MNDVSILSLRLQYQDKDSDRWEYQEQANWDADILREEYQKILIKEES